MMTTSGFDETTTGSSSGTEAVSTSTEGETTTGAPDLTSGTETDGATTGDETTGDASTGEASTGEEQTCPDPRGECLATGVWCVDLALFCERIDLADVSPNFCEGLAGVCATGEVAPCETCDGLVEQCEIGGAAMSCEAIAAECACLAAG